MIREKEAHGDEKVIKLNHKGDVLEEKSRYS